MASPRLDMLLLQGHLLPGRSRTPLVVLTNQDTELTASLGHMTSTSSVLTPNLVFLIILQRTAEVALWELGWGMQGGEGGSLLLIPHMLPPHSKFLPSLSWIT